MQKIDDPKQWDNIVHDINILNDDLFSLWKSRSFVLSCKASIHKFIIDGWYFLISLIITTKVATGIIVNLFYLLYFYKAIFNENLKTIIANSKREEDIKDKLLE